MFPSLHEGLPVSLIEAQGAGLPCLISDRVSPEVDLGMNLVEYAPLENQLRWIDKVNKITLNQMTRSTSQEAFVTQGYEITATANQVEDFYLSISG